MMRESLIRQLATRREPSGDRLVHRYDADEKISYVCESGSWVASPVSSAVGETKKADRETGEDQKGA
jgi:hypothetical protein